MMYTHKDVSERSHVPKTLKQATEELVRTGGNVTACTIWDSCTQNVRRSTRPPWCGRRRRATSHAWSAWSTRTPRLTRLSEEQTTNTFFKIMKIKLIQTKKVTPLSGAPISNHHRYRDRPWYSMMLKDFVLTWCRGGEWQMPLEIEVFPLQLTVARRPDVYVLLLCMWCRWRYRFADVVVCVGALARRPQQVTKAEKTALLLAAQFGREEASRTYVMLMIV